MLVDCTDLLAATGADPGQFASLLRRQIHQKTGCTASAGMGKGNESFKGVWSRIELKIFFINVKMLFKGISKSHPKFECYL